MLPPWFKESIIQEEIKEETFSQIVNDLRKDLDNSKLFLGGD